MAQRRVSFGLLGEDTRALDGQPISLDTVVDEERGVCGQAGQKGGPFVLGDPLEEVAKLGPGLLLGQPLAQGLGSGDDDGVGSALEELVERRVPERQFTVEPLGPWTRGR